MALDDPQRNILAVVGGVLMSGGIAWVAATISASPWPWPARVFPAVGMFVLGFSLMAWAWPGRSGWRATKKRVISEGRSLTQMPPHRTKDRMICDWEDMTYVWLQERGRSVAANDFSRSISGHTEQDRLRYQVALLESIKRRKGRRAR